MRKRNTGLTLLAMLASSAPLSSPLAAQAGSAGAQAPTRTIFEGALPSPRRIFRMW